MVQKAMDNGLLRTSEDLITNIRNGVQTENQYILDLSTHAYILSQLEEKNYENSRDIDITTAEGEALDNLGRLVNVHRNPAQPLVVEVTVGTGVALSENVTVPIGTKVLLQGVYDDVAYDFTTNEDLTIPAGSTEGKVYANSSILGYYGSLPIGAVVGLQGFPDLSATNTDATTGGKNIEEDDDYRERIRRWSTQNNRGTREIIETYLDNYIGLNGYNLVPRFEGIGTLKIVCDTVESRLDDISNDVFENCMYYTDIAPVCVLPDDDVLSSLTVSVSLKDGELRLTLDELKQLVESHIRIYVDGGVTRKGTVTRGMSIGEDFVPAQVIAFLVDEIDELNNVIFDTMQTILVDSASKFKIQAVTVEII